MSLRQMTEVHLTKALNAHWQTLSALVDVVNAWIAADGAESEAAMEQLVAILDAAGYRSRC